jgi:hypothetical protein
VTISVYFLCSVCVDVNLVYFCGRGKHDYDIMGGPVVDLSSTIHCNHARGGSVLYLVGLLHF